VKPKYLASQFEIKQFETSNPNQLDSTTLVTLNERTQIKGKESPLTKESFVKVMRVL
jgi:hypothetical protein